MNYLPLKGVLSDHREGRLIDKWLGHRIKG